MCGPVSVSGSAPLFRSSIAPARFTNTPAQVRFRQGGVEQGKCLGLCFLLSCLEAVRLFLVPSPRRTKRWTCRSTCDSYSDGACEESVSCCAVLFPFLVLCLCSGAQSRLRVSRMPQLRCVSDRAESSRTSVLDSVLLTSREAVRYS